MPFVNEYISEDDLNKSGIEEVWLRYHPIYKRTDRERPKSFRFSWTVDHERNIYFAILTGPDRDEHYMTCLLSVKDERVIIYLRLSGDGSNRYSDVPYKRVWELKNNSKYDAELLSILKEALSVYGCDGIERQVPNTVVEFLF